MTFPLRQLAFAVLALAGVASMLRSGQAQEPDAALRDKWQKAYRGIAESLDVRQGETKLELHDRELLFYTNPVRSNDQHGSIFLWTQAGRPAVFGSIWSALNRNDPGQRNVTHELHSLVEDSNVQAVRGGAEIWSSGEPGIAWQMLADAPAPAASRAARLVQMRNLARRLTASITAEEESELRLMSRPLYRYPEKAAVDGALFVFTMATDPELIVLLESRGESNKAIWSVAFARFGNLSMAVADGERTLWTCDRGQPGRSEGKYYLKWRAEQMPSDTNRSSPNSEP